MNGMVNVLSRAGSVESMNVLTVTPVVPSSTDAGMSDNPLTPAKPSEGSYQEVNTSVNPGPCRTIAFQWSVGSPAATSE